MMLGYSKHYFDQVNNVISISRVHQKENRDSKAIPPYIRIILKPLKQAFISPLPYVKRRVARKKLLQLEVGPGPWVTSGNCFYKYIYYREKGM